MKFPSGHYGERAAEARMVGLQERPLRPKRCASSRPVRRSFRSDTGRPGCAGRPARTRRCRSRRSPRRATPWSRPTT
jgi:hypothetical protein